MFSDIFISDAQGFGKNFFQRIMLLVLMDVDALFVLIALTVPRFCVDVDTPSTIPASTDSPPSGVTASEPSTELSTTPNTGQGSTDGARTEQVTTSSVTSSNVPAVTDSPATTVTADTPNVSSDSTQAPEPASQSTELTSVSARPSSAVDVNSTTSGQFAQHTGRSFEGSKRVLAFSSHLCAPQVTQDVSDDLVLKYFHGLKAFLKNCFLQLRIPSQRVVSAFMIFVSSARNLKSHQSQNT